MKPCRVRVSAIRHSAPEGMATDARSSAGAPFGINIICIMIDNIIIPAHGRAGGNAGPPCDRMSGDRPRHPGRKFMMIRYSICPVSRTKPRIPGRK
ncbi:hypothetical protein CFR78_15255 [Komagataeibacter rhaeticus]|nr:hypothetical protein GLUCORHAEAF1_08220 [Komagataeibacter rhaeticus AF1]PYD52355.1 hypothetical protein CFR78_15255 [Komagataeibacter rhaeticus]